MRDERTVLILGCGYVGLALARRLTAEGLEVIGTTRSPDRHAELREAGVTPFTADTTDPASLRPLVEARPDVVFDLVKPQRIAESRYTSWGTRNVVSAFCPGNLEALVYVSSTSVYGRRDGEWTDEDTPVDPVSPIALARVEAEGLYLQCFRERSGPVRIARVPGIYGPGRTLRQRLETGAYRRLDDDSLWVSRIHVEDLVSGLIAAWRRGESGRIYLLSDDEPTTAQDYAELTASLLSIPLPPTVEREDIRQEVSRDSFERRISSRRCRNQRMREELGVDLRYPTIREGVPAALREEGAV